MTTRRYEQNLAHSAQVEFCFWGNGNAPTAGDCVDKIVIKTKKAITLSFLASLPSIPASAALQ
jgi:hypothetical protein